MLPHIATITLAATTLAANPDAGSFPAPRPDERCAEYVARWDAWIDQFDESDHAWPDVLAVQDTILAAVERGEIVLRPSERDQHEWEAFGQFVRSNPDLVAEVHAYASKPILGMPPDVDTGEMPARALDISIPGAGPLSSHSKIIYAAAQLPNADLAASVRTLGALADLITQPHFLVSQLIAMAIHELGLDLASDAITRSTAESLSETQSVMADWQPLTGLRRAMTMAHWSGIDMRAWVFEGAGDDGVWTEKGRARWRSVLESTQVFGMPSPTREDLDAVIQWTIPVEELHIRFHADMYAMLGRDLAAPLHMIRVLEHREERDRLNKDPITPMMHSIVLVFFAEWRGPMRLGVAQQTRINATRLRIAVERHHRRHNEYPASIDAIDPDLLDFEPTDLFTGQPLFYQLVDGQPLIYSAGPDRDDDRAAKAPEDPTWLTLSELEEADPTEIDGDLTYFGNPAE